MRLLVSITQTRNLHAYNPEALVTDLKVRWTSKRFYNHIRSWLHMYTCEILRVNPWSSRLASSCPRLWEAGKSFLPGNGLSQDRVALEARLGHWVCHVAGWVLKTSLIGINECRIRLQARVRAEQKLRSGSDILCISIRTSCGQEKLCVRTATDQPKSTHWAPGCRNTQTQAYVYERKIPLSSLSSISASWSSWVWISDWTWQIDAWAQVFPHKLWSLWSLWSLCE